MNTKQGAGANTWVDPDDAPELTSEHFERADWYNGDRLIRRGRPPTGNAKKLVSLRIDPDVLERLRALGPGWQTRVADALRDLADSAVSDKPEARS
jgi:uncharacterized protein (DUF4415 family)